MKITKNKVEYGSFANPNSPTYFSELAIKAAQEDIVSFLSIVMLLISISNNWVIVSIFFAVHTVIQVIYAAQCEIQLRRARIAFQFADEINEEIDHCISSKTNNNK